MAAMRDKSNNKQLSFFQLSRKAFGILTSTLRQLLPAVLFFHNYFPPFLYTDIDTGFGFREEFLFPKQRKMKICTSIQKGE